MVVEQPIAGTPVYRVQPVTGGNIRTLHRNNKSQPQSQKERPVEFDSNVDIFPDSDLKSSLSDSNVVQESARKESNISSEDSSDKVIP